MTPIATMVERMLSGGIPPEMIVLAVETAERHAEAVAGDDPVAAKRRAYDRKRKREASTGIPPEGHIIEDNLTSEGSKKKKDIIRASRIPPEWTPSEVDVAAAKSLGLTSGDIAKQAARFRDYWSAKAGKDGTKLDWAATWRNWVRNFADKEGRTPPAGSPSEVPLSGFYAQFASEELDAWAAYERSVGKSYPRDKAGGWRFPTQWPPDKLREAG